MKSNITTAVSLNCTGAFDVPNSLTWISGIILWLLVVFQLILNSTMIYILTSKTKWTKANAFILSLASSDILSGCGGIIGALREEIGQQHFNMPKGNSDHLV